METIQITIDSYSCVGCDVAPYTVRAQSLLNHAVGRKPLFRSNAYCSRNGFTQN